MEFPGFFGLRRGRGGGKPGREDIGSESNPNQVALGSEPGLWFGVRSGSGQRGRSGWSGPVAPREVLILMKRRFLENPNLLK